MIRFWPWCLLFAAMTAAAEPDEYETAQEEGGSPVVIQPDEEPDAYRDVDGNVHYKAEVLGNDVCVRVDTPNPAITFDAGSTYVAPCAASVD
jgi:hypothetical protein